jgi:glycosidase
MVAAYKKIIAFRAAHEAIKTGVLTAYTDNDIVAFEKKSGTDDLVVLVNTRNSTINYSVPVAIQGAWTDGLASSAVALSTQLSLAPYQYVILKK